MAEYIEREATVNLLRSLGDRDYRREKGTIADAIKMVSHPAYTPSADVVEVVRCGQCKHWKPTSSESGRCAMCDCAAAWLYDDFCSYGVRRDTDVH